MLSAEADRRGYRVVTWDDGTMSILRPDGSVAITVHPPDAEHGSAARDF
jgi:hypothetical protein